MDGRRAAYLLQRGIPHDQARRGCAGIFTFVNSWNDYFLQLIMLNSRTQWTISLGIRSDSGRDGQRLRPHHGRCLLWRLSPSWQSSSRSRNTSQGIAMGAVKG